MNAEIYWQAISNNDARFDGAFVYAVGSTGIYCRPSCASRRPKRGNVAVFADPAAAEAGGFRACRRCRPQLSAAADPQVAVVRKACALLDADAALTLDRLGAALGVSPAHLQKTFKEIIGVSPKKYAEHRRLEKFRENVRAGGDLTGALYDAGFGSSSRLYENVAAKLGMTPRAYSKKGENMKINYTVADCRLGKLLVARTAKGLCAVTFGDDAETLAAALRREYAGAVITESDDGLKDCVATIAAAAEGRKKTLDLPLDLQATAFQLRVWNELRKIPHGATATYSEIAARIGNPNAVRAVASACAANRVALVVPCHRVVGKNGALAGYRWGVERKKELLDGEKFN